MTHAALSNLFADLDRDCLPHLSVNGVVFGAHAGALQVLLIRWAAVGQWALPGAYVRRDEGVDEAAARMVHEHVGLRDAALQQFHTFGARDRVGAALAAGFRALGVEPPPGHWALGRVVSVGYVALVDASQARAEPPPLSQPLTPEYAWWDVAARPALMLDHDAMVELALARVRARLDDLPLGATLLPGAFTMSELQRLYETVLGRSLDRRNFQKRILDLGLVDRLPDQRTGGRHRPPQLYRWAGRGKDLDGRRIAR
jgi:ADP-ribose pyrophosphatase YjhB (NUDIX family)